MKHLPTAGLAAAAILLAVPGTSPANHPKQCSYGLGWGGHAMTLFSKLHQHGPLFNYGPYYGYPPFEPYGPWNRYLQYDPSYYGYGYGGHGGGDCGPGGCGKPAHGGWAVRDGCSGCGLREGWHAPWRGGGWFRGHGCLSCGLGHRERDGLFSGHGGWGHALRGSRSGLCNTCGTTGTAVAAPVSGGCAGGGCKAAAFDPAADPVARFAGAGHPIQAAAFYSGVPALELSTVVPAGATAR